MSESSSSWSISDCISVHPSFKLVFSSGVCCSWESALYLKYGSLYSCGVWSPENTREVMEQTDYYCHKNWCVVDSSCIHCEDIATQSWLVLQLHNLLCSGKGLPRKCTRDELPREWVWEAWKTESCRVNVQRSYWAWPKYLRITFLSRGSVKSPEKIQRSRIGMLWFLHGNHLCH